MEGSAQKNSTPDNSANSSNGNVNDAISKASKLVDVRFDNNILLASVIT